MFAGGVDSVAGEALATALGVTVAFSAAGAFVFVGVVLVVALRGISATTRMTAEASVEGETGDGSGMVESEG